MLNINKSNFEEISKSQKPVIIKVYATWCGPCQLMVPAYEELEQELNNKYTFANLNVDEARDIAKHFMISSVPTILFIKNNQVVGQEIGYMSKEDLQEKIQEYLG